MGHGYSSKGPLKTLSSVVLGSAVEKPVVHHRLFIGAPEELDDSTNMNGGALLRGQSG